MKEARSWRRSELVPWAILSGFFVLWLIFFSITPPRAGGTDVFVFRDAGYNWAQGRGLVAESVPHHADSAQPMLFASYTPGDPFLFGLAASLFGGSGSVDSFYNLTFAALACFLLYWCFTLADTSGRRRLWAALLIGALLPTGLVAVDHDRPEVPALCLLVAILLLWRRSSSTSGRCLLFASVGFVFLLHPFAGIAGWLLLVFLLFFQEEPSGSKALSQPGPWRERLWVLIGGTALYALILAACALWMWHWDPTSLHRFLEHATGKDTGVGVVLHRGIAGGAQPAGPFHSLFNRATPASAALAISLLFSGLLVVFYAFRASGVRQRLLQCALLVLILIVFPLAVFPNQANYFGLSRALLLAVLTVGGFPLANALRGSRAPLALVLVTFLFLSPWTGLEALKNWEARTSYHREREQAKRVRAYFDRQGVENPEILVDPGHYFLYKQYFPNLHDLDYLKQGVATVQYRGLVLCYTSSAAFTRAQLPWEDLLARSRWRLIDGGEDRLRITLFGHPIMRRNWTWMCDVYARQS